MTTVAKGLLRVTYASFPKQVYSPLAASSSKTTSSSDPDLPAYAEVLKARRRAPAPVAAPRRGSRGPRRAVPHQEVYMERVFIGLCTLLFHVFDMETARL